jgi:hypothetical protein
MIDAMMSRKSEPIQEIKTKGFQAFERGDAPVLPVSRGRPKGAKDKAPRKRNPLDTKE